MPPARPQAATQPFGWVWAITLARVWEPTVSTAPDHRARCNGRGFGSESSARSMISAAPSAVRYPASAGRPVEAITWWPRRASTATATLPTPPAAPVTTTGPDAGVTPCSSSASTQSMAV